MKLRTVLVEDEPLARGLLREMLAAHCDVELVAEHGDGASALAAITADTPDLLFLDVQMPELDGVELARALPAGRPLAVIFVSAFDRYALDAFDVAAVDYLLKPFDETRLARALARARRHLAGGEAPLSPPSVPAVARRRLVVRHGERTRLVPLDQVIWLQADGKEVRVHTTGGSLSARESLAALSARLDPDRFLRVSRSAVVNLDRLREVQPWFRGELMLLLDGSARVATTRGFREAVKKALAAAMGRPV